MALNRAERSDRAFVERMRKVYGGEGRIFTVAQRREADILEAEIDRALVVNEDYVPGEIFHYDMPLSVDTMTVGRILLMRYSAHGWKNVEVVTMKDCVRISFK